jgi:hypothetical protein
MKVILSLKSIIYYIKKHRFEVLQVLKTTQKSQHKMKTTIVLLSTAPLLPFS